MLRKLLGPNNKDVSLKICWGSHLHRIAVQLLWKRVFMKLGKIKSCSQGIVLTRDKET